MEVEALLKLANKAVATLQNNRVLGFRPYFWQKAYMDAGKDNRFRLTLAGNQVGKTLTTCVEDTFHLTGNYPDWWNGVRFEHPTRGWICSITSETSRDILQAELLGEPIGTGLIPKEDILNISHRQAGISNVIDKVEVRNKFGSKPSIAQFKSYDQGWRKFQGANKIDFIHMDEEPDSNNAKEARIPTEIMTRMVARPHSRLYASLTPLLGSTPMIRKMQETVGQGSFIITASWDDAPHLTNESKRELMGQYPDFEIDARTKGIPMMGSGRVFRFGEETIKIEPFEIPRHFARITGIDYGQNHPNGTAALAIDRDTDVWYIYYTERAENQQVPLHVMTLNNIGGRDASRWIPVAGPHDGLNRESDGKALADKYIEAGANLLFDTARYDDDKGGKQPVEPIVMEFNERAQTGRLKVFVTCWHFFDEMRSYHRDDSGNIVAKRDDVLKAAMYAGMMARHATQNIQRIHRPAYGAPVISTPQ